MWIWHFLEAYKVPVRAGSTIILKVNMASRALSITETGMETSWLARGPIVHKKRSKPFSTKAPFQQSLSNEIVWHSREVIMTSLTTETGDYWNVSVAVHAEGGTSIAAELLAVKTIFLWEDFTLFITRTDAEPICSIDASLFTHIKGGDLGTSMH